MTIIATIVTPVSNTIIPTINKAGHQMPPLSLLGATVAGGVLPPTGWSAPVTEFSVSVFATYVTSCPLEVTSVVPGFSG